MIVVCLFYPKKKTTQTSLNDQKSLDYLDMNECDVLLVSLTQPLKVKKTELMLNGLKSEMLVLLVHLADNGFSH